MGPVCFSGGGGGETINIKKGPASPITARLHWVGICIGILFWFIDSAIDAFIFGKYTFIEQIFTPDPMDIWMRLLVVFLFIIFGLYAQHTSQVEALNKNLEEEISRRKLAEEELNAMAKFPVENPNPVLRVAKDGTILYANRACSSLLNLWGCQIGQPLPDYWRKSIFSVHRYGSSAEIEVDLGDRTLALDLLPIAGTDYVVLYGRDITERKQTETALKESEERFRSVVQSTMDAIVLGNSKGEIIFWNKGAQTIFGYSEEEVLGKPLAILMPERYRDAHKKGFVRFLSTGEGNVIGKVVELHGLRKDGGEFPLELSISTWMKERERFFAGILRNISERKQAEEAIHHMAYYDLLTNLPNRLMLHDSIERVISAGKREMRPFALLLIGLDRFKEINDTLGHHNGDLILQQMATRLQGIVNDDLTVARIGGDEFAVLLSNTDAEGSIRMAGNIMESLKTSFTIEDLSLDVSASIGISLFPGHGEDTHSLIRRADIAMYMAKKTESGYAVYSPQYDKYSPERLALMSELRSAVEQDQLFLLYQPKMDLKSGKTIGVEALVRWQHPKLGVIPPNDFISLAEYTGIINQVTLWVIKEAVRQSRTWERTGFELSIAVNLSVKSLQAQQLLNQIKGLLSTWGVASDRLRFEITESIIMADPELAKEIITYLTAMGVKFSIDDFGTGYSSLSYLQRLPVDEIKIDKSFVMNMMTDESSMKIVRSITELGHSLGLKVVAEGVENQETFEKLISIGCDAAQGYFISRPIPHAELTAWLRKQGQKPGGDKS